MHFKVDDQTFSVFLLFPYLSFSLSLSFLLSFFVFDSSLFDTSINTHVVNEHWRTRCDSCTRAHSASASCGMQQARGILSAMYHFRIDTSRFCGKPSSFRTRNSYEKSRRRENRITRVGCLKFGLNHNWAKILKDNFDQLRIDVFFSLFLVFNLSLKSHIVYHCFYYHLYTKHNKYNETMSFYKFISFS